MKVLWLCNTLIPTIATEIGVYFPKPESWIEALYEDIKTSNEDIDLIYLYPLAKKQKAFVGEYRKNNSIFIGFLEKNEKKLEKNQIDYFDKVLKKYKPDVIHIFGSEYPHCLAMIEACEKENYIDRSIINIQGLISVCAKHYVAFLSPKTCRKKTLRDIIKCSNINSQKKAFEHRGLFEKMAIQKCNNFIGRTNWDKACITRLNSNAHYYFCNETLRNVFYDYRWDYSKCQKHSIFISATSYPLKGFHIVLEALKELKNFYSDVHLYAIGFDPITRSAKTRLLQTYYQRYIGLKIKEYNLEKNITFLGYLNDHEMCDKFLNSNVFVCASSLENSSNSVSEAMILGLPVVASYVGGMPDIIRHGWSGYLYQADAPYMLAYYVKKFFDNPTEAIEMGCHAKQQSMNRHDRKQNYLDIVKIYNDIIEKSR